MQAQKIIEQLGFTTKEAKVYLAALGLGEFHISDLVEKLKLPRTSVYVIIDKLHKAGLMNFYMMRRRKYWVAEDPERLLHNLKQKEGLLEEVLPRLSILKRTGRRKKMHKDSYDLELFRMFADTTTSAVLITNNEIKIEYVNELWEKQFGYMFDEVQGENPKIFKSGGTPEEVYKKMWQALNAEKIFQTDKIINKRKDGTLVNIRTTIFSVQHGGNIFFIQILDEITEIEREKDL